MTNQLKAETCHYPVDPKPKPSRGVGFYTNVTRVYCALSMFASCLLVLIAAIAWGNGHPGEVYTSMLFGLSALAVFFSTALVGVLAEISRKLGDLN